MRRLLMSGPLSARCGMLPGWIQTASLLPSGCCGMRLVQCTNIAHILCTFQNHLLYDMDVCGVASDLLRRLGAIHTAFRRGGGGDCS